MAKKILALGASSSKKSINKQLANFAAQQLENTSVNLLDLNDFEMPIFSIDREQDLGIPEAAKKFKQHIREADGIIISFAEHNSAYSAAYKNIYDWVSRIEQDVWLSKPMLLLATSPGARGGRGVLELAHSAYGRANKNITGTFSLPSFGQNFSKEEGILDTELKVKLTEALSAFAEKL